MNRQLLRRVGAEFFGTFSLVAVGCGAIMIDALTGDLTHLGVALAFGLVGMVMVAATGHISGAHLNPAVTVAFAATRHFPWREVPLFALGQVLGSMAAATTLLVLFGPVAKLGATLPAGDVRQALGLETLLTAALMFVITSVATDTKAQGHLAAIVIGGTVGVNALWGGPISGASMNPARSFGPALMAGDWSYHWVYWVGPLVGALLGGLAYQLVREPVAQAGPPSNR